MILIILQLVLCLFNLKLPATRIALKLFVDYYGHGKYFIVVKGRGFNFSGGMWIYADTPSIRDQCQGNSIHGIVNKT